MIIIRYMILYDIIIRYYNVCNNQINNLRPSYSKNFKYM